MFTKRTNWTLTTNALMARFEALKKEKKQIINLTESNPTRCAFRYPQKEFIEVLTVSENMIYGPLPKGLLKARQAVSGYYQRKNVHVASQDIFLTSGTSEAYSFLFRLLLNPGERILIARPSYPLFEFLAQLNDVKVDFYSLIYREGWTVDIQSLEEGITPKTRAIVMVNPNNPTGSFLKKEELKIINKICQEKNMAIICDEVFLDYSFKGSDSVSLAQNKEVLTFILSGISKILALPQMKIGWIVTSGPPELVQAALERLEIIADTYLSVNTPSQNALSSWLASQSDIQSEIKKRLKENYNFLVKTLSISKDCHCLQTEGGWYAIVRLPKDLSEEEWAMTLLEKDFVFVHPGYFFDFEEEPFIVVSLLSPKDIFMEGIHRIQKRVKAVLS